jgi:hypothetical protein
VQSCSVSLSLLIASCFPLLCAAASILSSHQASQQTDSAARLSLVVRNEDDSSASCILRLCAQRHRDMHSSDSGRHRATINITALVLSFFPLLRVELIAAVLIPGIQACGAMRD